MADEGQVFALIGSAKNPIKVACNEYEGRRMLDIRRYYVDKSTAELRPTTKGISITKDSFRELLNVIEQNKKAIDEWLDGGERERSDDVAQRNDRANKVARLNARLTAMPIDVIHDLWKGGGFFACRSEGGKDVVVLNEGHSLLSALKEVESGQRNVEELIGCLLVSFTRAKNIFQGSEEPLVPEDVIELMDFNWGLYLGALLDPKKK